MDLWYIGVLLVLLLFYKLFRPTIKGFVGEKSIALKLSALPRSKYLIINNLVLNSKGKTSQIDHLVISDHGLFVIETKNLKGWIIGTERSEYWRQVIYRRKEWFYNPIHQNCGHIMALTHCLPDFPGVKFIPIVVFANHATIKVKSVSHVVYASQLKKLIRSYSEIILSEEEKQRIYERITSMNVSSKYSRSAHIKSIKRRIKERGQLVMQDKCPRCGAELVLKTGKFGDFKGCCRFPSCMYTVN